MNKIYQTNRRCLWGILLAFVACCFVSCSDDDNAKGTGGFDPSRSVEITDFVPKSGSVGQQLVIYGSNFGNNVEDVKLTIGGKPAVVVNVKDNCLYTYVPSGAFSGEISITVGNETLGTQTAMAEEVFEYQRKMVVGKLCGYKNERDDQGWNDGPFATCTGFRNDGVMQFSPYNHDQLFIVYDREPNWEAGHGIQLLDLKEQTVKTILPLSMFNNERLRTVDFAVDPFAYDDYGGIVGRADDAWLATASARQLSWKEHLIIAADNDDSNYKANSVYIVNRDKNGQFSNNSTVSKLACYRQCNGASLHPVNGELYFTSYTKGEFLRLDMDKYWDTVEAMATDPEAEPWDPYLVDNVYNSSTGSTLGSGAFERLFTIQDNGWEFQIDIHPSGKYAYIVVINKSYILRTDYNEKTKKFSAPYQVAGDMSARGFVDGVGKSALMRRPYQGTFVKNDKYVEEGRDDVYDFYFCDSENNALRYLTPEGIVSTYAGGSAATHADGNTEGSENGELRDVARFYRPTGLVNDFHIDKISGEKTLIFYILDTKNCCIRTITMEEEEDTSDTPVVDDAENAEE
ncbi:MAG: IPT/TIG domain-containing protein [Prevotella sp.]